MANNISMAQAAEIFSHYLQLALERSGVHIGQDGYEELRKATEAFASCERVVMQQAKP
jgi:hypothetical protein